MPWDDAQTFVDDLSEALSNFDWSRTAEICRNIINRIHSEPEHLPEETAKKCLFLLRRKRRFRLMTQLAEALFSTGRREPQIRRQYAQALIDQGMLTAAESVLSSLLKDSMLDDVEKSEAHGLLGSIYKQHYVNAGSGANQSVRAFIERALSEYSYGYRLDPQRNLRHAVNLVALQARAMRDGISPAGYPHLTSLAENILHALAPENDEVKLEPWGVAIVMEAFLVLGLYREAEERALEYAAHPSADAFEIAGTLKQLTEVWQLEKIEPHGPRILSICRAALLRRKGGVIRIDPHSVEREMINVESTREELGAAVESGLGTLSRYEQALKSCRAVVRIETRDGQGRGTGLLVRSEDFLPGAHVNSRVLLLTNAHVISPTHLPTALAPFEAVVNLQVHKRRIEVDEVIWSSPPDELDATLLTLREDLFEVEPLRIAHYRTERPDMPLRPYLIGHPGGSDAPFSLKAGAADERFSFQDTYVTATGATSLQYRTPVSGGSSGSALFDPSDWAVIALHHSGQSSEAGHDGESVTHINEGASISAIRTAVHERMTEIHAISARRVVLRNKKKKLNERNLSEFVEREFRFVESTGEATWDEKDTGASFYFAFEGKEQRGRFVRYGSEVDLIFNYDLPPVEAIATVKGAGLSYVRNSQTPLGIRIAPVGFTFRNENDVGFRVMKFYDEGRSSDKVRFELRAADAPLPEQSPATGFHVIFEVSGSILYQFFLPAELVSNLPETAREDAGLRPLSLDLDRINEFGRHVAVASQRMEAAIKEVLANA